jgi:hypothetical protein
MKTINRSDLIAETFIREHIAQRIRQNLKEQQDNENNLRGIIRRLMETETGTDEPSQYTGINVLASTLEKIIPVVEDDYKMLTTSSEQRESFRNHIIHAIKNSLRPIETAEKAMPENYQFEIDADILLEKVVVDLTPEEDEVENIEGEFIDIGSGDGSDTDQFVELDDQNETGRNFAATTYKKVEKQIVDAYDMLADEEDQNLFYDYMLTNMLLYFDKFEDELQPNLPDTTTPEYEKEAGELEKDEETDVEATEDPEAADLADL